MYNIMGLGVNLCTCVVADCDDNNCVYRRLLIFSKNYKMYNYAHVHVCMLPVSISYFDG